MVNQEIMALLRDVSTEEAIVEALRERGYFVGRDPSTVKKQVQDIFSQSWEVDEEKQIDPHNDFDLFLDLVAKTVLFIKGEEYIPLPTQEPLHPLLESLDNLLPSLSTKDILIILKKAFSDLRFRKARKAPPEKPEETDDFPPI